jgi:hypothetical protein
MRLHPITDLLNLEDVLYSSYTALMALKMELSLLQLLRQYMLFLIHTRGPSVRALWLCSPSTHFYHTENRALRPDKKLCAPIPKPPS